jgi:hypothetical protein
MRENKADLLKLKELAEKYGLTVGEVRNIVHSQFEFVRVTNRNLIIPDGLTREEFRNLKTNFTFPALGKMYASHFLYDRIQENKKKK